ncbi:threonyl-tRNA synthetase [Coelomomyces lativittatus]|nr:threonyl-tRNA synthetase [Coelomomyces lativittatus]KAJ1515210.1 threonyl-tRNA synthetase [Coelomomyces lativittatus]KAJ1517916.1 threonyl-tRNA synthetase [Coelomomyces lativittatus]
MLSWNAERKFLVSFQRCCSSLWYYPRHLSIPPSSRNLSNAKINFDLETDNLRRASPTSSSTTSTSTSLSHPIKATTDHRTLGQQQQLFFFHPSSPGSCFFLPHGTRIVQTLLMWLKSEYKKRGYHEVMTPTLYHTSLWKTSGHWDKYHSHMFHVPLDEHTTYSMKPMNCPAHCLMYLHIPRSYRDLPLRFADFGVLHRNEDSGSLTGLTRVRKFQQDDAHIFCTLAQLTHEIHECLCFLQEVYQTFGFSFTFHLSTRPTLFLGPIEVWDKAEHLLEKALDDFGHPWTRRMEEGAFYGPKIDVIIKDGQGRPHQCGTLQLDFQLPERFDLTYDANPNEDAPSSTQLHRPVMIHRAILGSVERMLAILTEHFQGKWPFWLSPRQLKVLPVSPASFQYAQQVYDRLHQEDFHVDLDLGETRLNKKIRNAELEKFNFILVVGNEEEKESAVNVRDRDDPSTKVKGKKIPLDDFIKSLQKLKSTRSMQTTI